MAKLLRKSDQQVLIPNLTIAASFVPRLVGLLASAEIKEQEGLLIERCNSVHTFFMRFPIDCVFLNKQMQIAALKKNIKPWRMTWPEWSARSVIELKAGRADELGLQLGDELHVGN